MSQYLNIYIVPKGGEKPILLKSYCRNSPVCDSFLDTLVIRADQIPLTQSQMAEVVQHAEEEVKQSKQWLNEITDAFGHVQNVSTELWEEFLANYSSRKNLVIDSVETLAQIKFLYNFLFEESDNDVDTILVNYE